MKKLLILCVFTLFNTHSFAETGKFNASGMGSWEVNVMDCLLYTSPSPRDGW